MCRSHLVTDYHIVLYSAEEHQVESQVDHPQVGTQGMQIPKHTGRQPVTHTLLQHKTPCQSQTLVANFRKGRNSAFESVCEFVWV